MGCSGHKAVDVVEVEHVQIAARRAPTAMKHSESRTHGKIRFCSEEHLETDACRKPTAMNHVESATHGKVTTTAKDADCGLSEQISEKSFDSVWSPISSQSLQSKVSATSAASTSCSEPSRRDELMDLSALLDLEKNGGRTDEVSNSKQSLGVVAKIAKLHSDNDSSHIVEGCEVAVNNTGVRGKVMALLGAGRCLVKVEGHTKGMQMRVKDLQALPESLNLEMRESLSLPKK